MARPNQFRRTERVRVEQANDTGRLSVVAPSNVQADVSTGEALMGALGIGVKVAARVQEDNHNAIIARAERDFAAGEIDEKMYAKRKAYGETVDELETRAGWIQSKAEIDAVVRDSKIEDLPPDEQGEALDKVFESEYRRLYGGVEADTKAASFVVPEFLKHMESHQKILAERNKLAFEERTGANLQMVAGDAYATAREAARASAPAGVIDSDISASSHFDYAGTHAFFRKTMPGAESNEAYFTFLKNMAVRNGDPELLANVPDKWEDGTDTFKHIPAYVDEVRSAEMAALAVRNQRTAQLEELAKKQAEAAQEEVLGGAVMNMMAGRDATEQVEEFLRLGGKASTAASIRRAQSSIINDVETREPNLNTVARLTADAYSGLIGRDEILAELANGAFGKGPASLRRVDKLLSVAQQQESYDADTRRRLTYHAAHITGVFNPGGDALTGLGANPLIRTLQADALFEFNNLVENGKEPAAAHAEVLEKWKPRLQLLRENALGMDERNLTAAQGIRHIVQGTLDPGAIKRMGITKGRLAELLEAEEITAEEARAIRIYLNQ